MIKSNIKNQLVDGFSFPKLMISEDREVVVLFSCPDVGVALTGDDVGQHSAYWNMTTFSNFVGSLTLTNED